MSVEGVLFIDANQYLDLYRMVGGKKLLAVLEEQRDYIFVTAQVVDEVHRQKVRVAASFLAEQIRKLEPKNVPVPDHLLSASDGRVVTMREKLRETSEKIKDTKEELKKLTRDLLERVSQSRDEVSKTLAGVFSKAVAHTEDELQRRENTAGIRKSAWQEHRPSRRPTELGADFDSVQKLHQLPASLVHRPHAHPSLLLSWF